MGSPRPSGGPRTEQSRRIAKRQPQQTSQPDKVGVPSSLQDQSRMPDGQTSRFRRSNAQYNFFTLTNTGMKGNINNISNQLEQQCALHDRPLLQANNDNSNNQIIESTNIYQHRTNGNRCLMSLTQNGYRHRYHNKPSLKCNTTLILKSPTTTQPKRKNNHSNNQLLFLPTITVTSRPPPSVDPEPLLRRQQQQTQHRITTTKSSTASTIYPDKSLHPALLMQQALRYHREVTTPCSAQASGSATISHRNSCELSHIHSTAATNSPRHTEAVIDQPTLERRILQSLLPPEGASTITVHHVDVWSPSTE
uniref:Uncharacterized protein n=1 Tax=Glossina austeni TaxID=7395 RepID=A0A1A9USF9_GLOAU